MTTSDPHIVSPGGGATDPRQQAFAEEIARALAAIFSQGPHFSPGATASPVPTPTPLVVPAIAGPGVIAPPNPGPSALALGAGGISGAQNGPPTPGFLQQP